VLVPEAGGPTGIDNAGPYTMTGLAWEQNPLAKLPARQNAFEATLTGARAATLDTARMGLSNKEVIRGKVTTDHPLVLTLTSERIAKEIRLPAGTREFVVRL
jgi:hypothetical protein